MMVRLMRWILCPFTSKTSVSPPDGDRKTRLSLDRQELISLLGRPALDELKSNWRIRAIRAALRYSMFSNRALVGRPIFPSLDPTLVGDGQTRALKNVAVVETDQFATHSRNIIDMRGPATAYSPLCNTHNVVLLPYPKPDADKDNYRLAVKKAGLKTATYLAAAAKDVAPHETQTFELPAVAFNQGRKDLPLIAYIFPMHSHQHPTQKKETVFYGSNIQGFMPTIVSPHEILDGALTFLLGFPCSRKHR